MTLSLFWLVMYFKTQIGEDKMKKLVVYLLGIFCLGFLSCQSLPLLEFSEKANKPSFDDVCLVLNVSHSDCMDYWDVEIEWLSLDEARKKAKMIKEIKEIVYSVYENRPKTLDNDKFLLWDQKASEEVRIKTFDLKQRLDQVDGYREIITVDREKYWWLGWGTIFSREFVETEQLEENVWRHNFYRYLRID